MRNAVGCAQEAPMLYCGEQIGTGQEPMVSNFHLCLVPAHLSRRILQVLL